MNGIKITSADVPHFLTYIQSKGQNFGADARKRSDGSPRTFNGRVENVDATNRLCVVQEQNLGGYRSINLDTLTRLAALGETFTFDGVPPKVWKYVTFDG